MRGDERRANILRKGDTDLKKMTLSKSSEHHGTPITLSKPGLDELGLAKVTRAFIPGLSIGPFSSSGPSAGRGKGKGTDKQKHWYNEESKLCPDRSSQTLPSSFGQAEAVSSKQKITTNFWAPTVCQALCWLFLGYSLIKSSQPPPDTVRLLSPLQRWGKWDWRN